MATENKAPNRFAAFAEKWKHFSARDIVHPPPNHPRLHPTGKSMFDPASIIVGLEIGTSKVCAVVGEANSTGALNIIGVGQARSRGVRKGEIADASAVAEDVRNAIAA